MTTAADCRLRRAQRSRTFLRSAKTHHLRISVVRIVGGGGHSGVVLRFKNRRRRCFLRGYPGVDGVRAGGKVVFHARRTRHGYLGGSSHRPRRVVLRRGRTASALLEGLSAPHGSRCRRYHRLVITPPDATRSVRRRPKSRLCKPEIHPVVHGRDGSNL